nr:MAG TPA: hypothetical protein [Caudoviricetes sp.]
MCCHGNSSFSPVYHILTLVERMSLGGGRKTPHPTLG